MKNKFAQSVFVAACAAAAAGIAFHCAAWRPINDADYTTVTGTLRFAEEHGGNKHRLLDIYFIESPVRFRVPQDHYEALFKRDVFFGGARPGDKLTIVVEKSQLQNPSRPLMDAVVTVFVCGLKNGRTTVYSFDDFKDARIRNRLYGWVLAAVLGIVAVLFAIQSKSEAARGSPASACRLPVEASRGGTPQ